MNKPNPETNQIRSTLTLAEEIVAIVLDLNSDGTESAESRRARMLSTVNDILISCVLGGTRRFPRGKMTSDDQGETRIAVGIQDTAVVMDFGAPTAWIGMSPESALNVARALTEKADQLRN